MPRSESEAVAEPRLPPPPSPPLPEGDPMALAARSVERAVLIGVEGVTSLWLVRHADSYADGEGQGDPGLSGRGRIQLDQLRRRLASADIAAVYSSPLLRAQQTAEAITDQVVLDPDLREVELDFSQGWMEIKEEPEVVVERMTSAVERAASAHPGQLVLLVSHAAALMQLVTALLSLEQGSLRILPDFTSVSVLRWHQGRLVVGSVGDATHLL